MKADKRVLRRKADGGKRRGYYLGTEINDKWWLRYWKDGLLARGIGEYWLDESAVFFRRYLTRAPIVIPFRDVTEVKTGTWHAGRWAGGAPVVKIVWTKGGRAVSSGFVFAKDAAETEVLVRELRASTSKANPSRE